MTHPTHQTRGGYGPANPSCVVASIKEKPRHCNAGAWRSRWKTDGASGEVGHDLVALGVDDDVVGVVEDHPVLPGAAGQVVDGAVIEHVDVRTQYRGLQRVDARGVRAAGIPGG